MRAALRSAPCGVRDTLEFPRHWSVIAVREERNMLNASGAEGSRTPDL